MSIMTEPRAEHERRPGRPGRFWLWIDGVGGYLVCERDVVTIGQPIDDGTVDVPILADISRHHAKVRRDGESYVLEPLRPVRADGRYMPGKFFLAHGMLIELGEGVKLRFLQPHPYSATARLDFVSHHRTQPAADGVLLLANSCVLGPGEACHVVCRDWAKDVVLYGQGGTLFCRTDGKLEIDGTVFREKGAVSRNSHVLGKSFCFSLEPA